MIVKENADLFFIREAFSFGQTFLCSTARRAKEKVVGHEPNDAKIYGRINL